jgi:hypothetical protein
MDTGRQKVGSGEMGTLRTRLRRLEKEVGFRRWLDFSRLLESLSDSQLEEVASDFRFPDPIPLGMSKLDGLDRKTLLGMWEEEESSPKIGRSKFCVHGKQALWPNEAGSMYRRIKLLCSA